MKPTPAATNDSTRKSSDPYGERDYHRGEKYRVGPGGLTLGYDSHVRAPTPSRYKTHPEGTILSYGSSAANGNVWFHDPDFERGKIEAGEIGNLTRDGRLVKVVATPEFAPGDIVEPLPGGYILRDGAGYNYGSAVVVQGDPFVLCSKLGDMMWTSTARPEFFHRVGTATAKEIAIVRDRLDRTDKDLLPAWDAATGAVAPKPGVLVATWAQALALLEASKGQEHRGNVARAALTADDPAQLHIRVQDEFGTTFEALARSEKNATVEITGSTIAFHCLIEFDEEWEAHELPHEGRVELTLIKHWAPTAADLV